MVALVVVVLVVFIQCKMIHVCVVAGWEPGCYEWRHLVAADQRGIPHNITQGANVKMIAGEGSGEV